MFLKCLCKMENFNLINLFLLAHPSKNITLKIKNLVLDF